MLGRILVCRRGLLLSASAVEGRRLRPGLVIDEVEELMRSHEGILMSAAPWLWDHVLLVLRTGVLGDIV